MNGVALPRLRDGVQTAFDVVAGDFRPRRWLRNAHLQTIAGNALPRASHLPEAETVLVEVAPARDATLLPTASLAPQTGRPDPMGPQIPSLSSRVLCHCHWQPRRVRRKALTAILLHGLEGSSESQYVLGNADKLWYGGCNVIRMNMRNCGGTEALSPTLYHSGMSGDVLAVMRHFLDREGLEAVTLVGYSMGGNLVLKLAGELGSQAPAELRSVVGVSPAIDLGISADALHEPVNRIYERRFLRSLLLRYRRKAILFPALFDRARAEGVRSIREFDDRITAPYSGFLGADDYYFRAASARVLVQIAVPTLILHAKDDPFVRLSAQTRAVLGENPYLTVVEPEHGGHCAFLARPDHNRGYDGYWAEHTLLRFVQAHMGTGADGSGSV